MQQIATEFSPLAHAKPLTAKQSDAAVRVAADRETDEEISEGLGINRTTLHRWKLLPDFQAAVATEAQRLIDAVRSRGIREIDNRVASQDERWRRLQRVIDARAKGMTEEEVEGGSTGLLTRQVKFVKVFVLPKSTQKALLEGNIDAADLKQDDFIPTKQTQAVTEYAVDTGLLAEMRAIETQSAKELGQLVERSESTAHIDLTDMTDEEVQRLASGKSAR